MITFINKNIRSNNGPVIAMSDYVKLVAEQISPYINCPFLALGTDGFGRSGTRDSLRDFFEVNKYYITLSSINLLIKDKQIKNETLPKAIKKYNIDVNKPNPNTV